MEILIIFGGKCHEYCMQISPGEKQNSLKTYLNRSYNCTSAFEHAFYK